MPQTPIDPLEALLRRSPVASAQRAELWDIYDGAGTADDLAAKLEAYNVPRQVKAQLWTLKSQETAPVPSELTSQGPEGSALGRFASNLGEMINPISLVTGAYNAVRHPIDTGKAILSQSGDQFDKAAQAGREGRYSEMIGHGLGAVPVVGPIAAEAGEQIAEGDIAGGLGKAVGILAPFGAAEVLARAGVRAVPKRVAGALERGAADRVADVIAPKSSTAMGRRMGNKAAKIAPELLERGDVGGWTRQGLQGRVGARLDDATVALDDAGDARLAARTYETQPVIDALRDKLDAQSVKAVEASDIVPIRSETAVPSHLTPDQSFVLRWLADDLREMPFQQGGSTAKGRRAAYETLDADEAHALKYNAHVGGTPTQDMFKALGMNGSRAEIADQLDKFLLGKSKSDKLPALADALGEAWDGQRFDFDLVSDPALVRAGIRRRDLKSPVSLARMDEAGAERFFPDDAIPPAPVRPGEATARPLGRDVVPAPNRARAGQIQRAISEVEQLGPVARYDSLKALRQAYDQAAQTAYNPSMTADYLKVMGEAKGAADVTGALRSHLAKLDPATAAANVEYSLYKGASDILKATEEIERVRPKVGRQIMARLTGSVVGGQQAGVAGAAAGFALGPVVEQALSAGFTTKLQTAKWMNDMAKAVRKGDVGRVTSLSFRARQLVKQAEASRAKGSASLQPSTQEQ